MTGKHRCLSLLLVLFLLLPFFCTRKASADAAAQSDFCSTKLIALTFDDGPSANTARLLDGLKARGVPATFFLTGDNGSCGASNYPELLKRMAEEGHQLANHTYSHADVSALSTPLIRSQLIRVEAYLFPALGGEYIDCVRTPGGIKSETICAAVNAPIVLWNVDPQDWKDRNAGIVYNRIMNSAKDGSIILLHDLYATSVEAALMAVDALQEQGYEFVTVAELFRRRGLPLEPGQVYYNAPNQGVTLPAYTAPVVTTFTDFQAHAVTVSCDYSVDGVTLHYTTDGSVPTLKSPVYTTPLTFSSSATLSVAGFDKYGTRTPVATRAINTDFTNVPTAEKDSTGAIALQCDTPDATIYYTTNGEVPTVFSSVYTAPIPSPLGVQCVAMSPRRVPSPATTPGSSFFGLLSPPLFLPPF